MCKYKNNCHMTDMKPEMVKMEWYKHFIARVQ